jgi:hypothetical protein
MSNRKNNFVKYGWNVIGLSKALSALVRGRSEIILTFYRRIIMFRKLIYLVSLVFLLSVSIPAKADLVITNGDFETGGGENITDVTDWYDNNAGGFWEDAWQTNASWVTPNGSNVVVFCSWDTVEGDPLAGSYLYQSIGTSTGESSVTIGFDWGHPDDAAADRYDGLTVSVLASDGSFVADDANDVLGAAGITLLDYASYDHVALGTDGEIFPVVVTLDLSGANAGDEIFLRFNNYIPEAGADPWPVLDNVQITSEPAPTTPFSLGAVEDIELGNDPQTGPDSNSNGSGLGARDVPDRRRVILISYDISALKERGPVSNVSFNHFSHDQHGEVNVYGVIEDLDLLEVESLTWNTAPGVQNDPTPELNSRVALDMNDLTDVLLSFAGPGEMGIRFSTGTSQALDDFINSDTDGILTFLIATAAEGNQLIIRARTHSAGGTLLEGEAPPLAKIIWVSDNLQYDFDAGVPSDQGFIDLLTAQGYLVDYKGQYDPHEPGNDEIPVNPDWLYWRELDDDKIAELEAADLIIIGRVNSSGSFDDANEAEMWNAISTPLISQSAHISRQYSKWGWFATGSTTNKTPRLMQVTAPDHDIFAGVEIDPDGNIDLVVQDAQVTLVKLNEGVVEGNGTLLGVHDEGYPWIVEWDAGVEYYEGSGQIAGGPRMFLGSAVGATNEAAGLIEGGYNLTADGETVFLNAVRYMLSAAPVAPVHSYTFEDGTANDSVGEAHGTLIGGAEIIDGAMVNAQQDGWMEMPGDVIAMNTFDEVTIEAWYTPSGGANGGFTMLASFGLTNPDADWMGVDYFMMTSARGDDVSRAAISIGNYSDPWATESSVNGPEYDDGILHHVVATLTATEIAFYIDGVLMGTSELAGDNHIEGISQSSAYLAKAPYGQDPEWIGSIEEFNIYNVALSAEQVAAKYDAGPVK